jgi:predicted HD superfamily hydrolase involved in NAD metabolism
MAINGDHVLRITPELEERVEAWARAKIPPNRLAHVEGVVSTVDRLAQKYAPDQVARARLAAWIHDAAKHWPDDELLDYAEAHGLPISSGERDVPMLLHGGVAYELANEIFGFDDPALRSAAAYHTTGAPGMNALDKIVFLGDLIEPGRDFPGVKELRQEAERDLDSAVLAAADQTLRHLIDKNRVIDPRAVLLRNELLEAGVRYNGSGTRAKAKSH